MNYRMNNALAQGDQTAVILKGVNEGLHIVTLDGQAVVSSRYVSETFNKEHKHVLDSIREIIKGVDENSAGLFIESNYQHSQNKQWYLEYLITRDGFTLLAMGFTGKEALQWKLKYIEAFNKMEKYILKTQKNSYMIDDPIERAKAWIIEQQEKQVLQLENAQQQQIIGELKPKATYYDLVLQSTDLMPISLIAKDYGMGAQTLNKKLNQFGVQYKRCGIWLLYEKYQAKGYTQSKTQSYPKPDGTIGTQLHTQWTQKGRLFIYDLLKQNGILPVIEREDKYE
ncbi:phage regulatory protein/antirepressor Ant [Cellulosilyticum sp. ST5]|uniref:Rha family transcriptional regulator n=1 Tax=Cellulosilyticum sp. ST5 TaxID=3055805 RepID=UPI003977B3CC